MSRSLLFGALALVFSLAACSTFQSTNRNPASTSEFVDPRYPTLQRLVAESLQFRAHALQFAEQKKVSDGKDIKVTRAEGDLIREMGKRYLQTREQLLAIALKDAVNFDYDHRVILTPGKGTSRSRIAKPGPVADRGLKSGVIDILNIDPLDREGQEVIFGIQMGLAASLILMDNYTVGVAPYNENKAIRYLLNYDTNDDTVQNRELQKIADSYTDPSRRSQISKAITFVDSLMSWRRERMIDTNAQEAYLYGVTQSSIWYVMAKSGETGTGISDRLTNLWNRIMLRGTRGVRGVTYGLSMGFGNMVGLYEERKGLMNDMSRSEHEEIISELKPLDILMEKTPFRLTDRFIPGHYGHVAIWLGTEEQLKELRVWDQIPRNVQDRIRAGHHIVEALRPGVQINSLEHFLNIDDFLVLRDTRSNLPDSYRVHAIKTAVSQLGKEYDFNFDVNTHNRIVCSEIAYVVFDDIQWPLSPQLGRYTISPDNVAQLAVGKQKIFEPVIMYHEGIRYKRDLSYSLNLLLKATDQAYEQVKRFENQ